MGPTSYANVPPPPCIGANCNAMTSELSNTQRNKTMTDASKVDLTLLSHTQGGHAKINSTKSTIGGGLLIGYARTY